jgi:hypothetical protein
MDRLRQGVRTVILTGLSGKLTCHYFQHALKHLILKQDEVSLKVRSLVAMLKDSTWRYNIITSRDSFNLRSPPSAG